MDPVAAPDPLLDPVQDLNGPQARYEGEALLRLLARWRLRDLRLGRGRRAAQNLDLSALRQAGLSAAAPTTRTPSTRAAARSMWPLAAENPDVFMTSLLKTLPGLSEPAPSRISEQFLVAAI